MNYNQKNFPFVTKSPQSPIDNSRVAKVPIATEGDVDAAVEAAEKAQPFWAALPAYARADALRRFSQLLVQNASKLAEVCQADFHSIKSYLALTVNN